MKTEKDTGTVPVNAGRKYVYDFDAYEELTDKLGGDWEAVRALLGGKGANLVDATHLGIPVPPGFTVTTEACNDYLAAGARLPEGLWEQAVDAVRVLEQKTGKRFGSIDNSGAACTTQTRCSRSIAA